MKVSNNAVNLIIKYEGFRNKAYLDPAGKWTIGYGTTRYEYGAPVKEGDTITKTRAKAILKQQIDEHASTIEKYVTVKLNQNQYDALASFQYNLGAHILPGTKLLEYINSKNWVAAAEQMKLFVNRGSSFELGLRNRREEEASLFLKVGFFPSVPSDQYDDTTGENEEEESRNIFYEIDKNLKFKDSKGIDFFTDNIQVISTRLTLSIVGILFVAFGLLQITKGR